MKEVIVVAILTISLLFAAVANAAPSPQKSPYPTITLYFADGNSTEITGKVWAATIFPIVEAYIHSYDWSKKIRYLFFDKSLKGLNPYGLDFVRAIESHTISEYDTNFYKVITNSINQIKDLDSDGDGYTNNEELNAGTYPGDPNDHPGKEGEKFWDEYGGYIILISIIASIFVLYFVFNREKD